MILGSGLIQSAWPRASDWLVRDEFDDTVAAGSVNGTAATPGPGTRTVTDTENKLSVGSGVAAFAGGKTSPAYGDPGLWYGAQTRAAGLAMIASVSPITSKFTHFRMGWDTNQAAEPAEATHFETGGALRAVSGAATAAVSTWDIGNTYVLAHVLRAAGMFHFRKSGANWVLDYLYSTAADASVYPSINNYSQQNTIGYVRVVQLPSPFNGDDGIATDTLAGSVSAGTTFTHEADMLLEFSISNVPGTNGVHVFFRNNNSGDRWRVRVLTNGNIDLYEYVSNTPIARGSAASVVTGADRIVIICDNESIKIYSGNTLRISYGTAVTAKTATDGSVSVVDGVTVSDLKTWPRTLSGTAASILNKVSA